MKMLPTTSIWSIEPPSAVHSSNSSSKPWSWKSKKAWKRARKGVPQTPGRPEKKAFQEVLESVMSYAGGEAGIYLAQFFEYDTNPLMNSEEGQQTPRFGGVKQSLMEIYSKDEQSRGGPVGHRNMLSAFVTWLRNLPYAQRYWLDPTNCAKIAADLQDDKETGWQEDIPQTTLAEVHPKKLRLDKEERKLHQVVNMAAAAVATARSGDTIVDFCGGSGHLAILLAYFLPSCKIVLVDYNKRSLDIAIKKAAALKLHNLSTSHSSIEDFDTHFDVGIGLHACGEATDVILHKCCLNKATVILAPCCVGKLQHHRHFQYPQSDSLRQIISSDEFLRVAKAGDVAAFASLKDTDSYDRRLCKTLVEVDRRCYLVERGYMQHHLLMMFPADSSAKNDILISSPNAAPNWENVRSLLRGFAEK